MHLSYCLSYRNFFWHSILKELQDLFSQKNGILPFSKWNRFASAFMPMFKLLILLIQKDFWREVKIWFKFKWSHSLLWTSEFVDIYFHTCRFRQDVSNLTTFKRWIIADCVSYQERLYKVSKYSSSFESLPIYWQLGKICKCKNRCQEVLQKYQLGDWL